MGEYLLDAQFLIGFTDCGGLCGFPVLDRSTGKDIVGAPITNAFDQRDLIMFYDDDGTAHHSLASRAQRGPAATRGHQQKVHDLKQVAQRALTPRAQRLGFIS